jgi:hypothetical protein
MVKFCGFFDGSVLVFAPMELALPKPSGILFWA